MFTGRMLGYVLAALTIADAACAVETTTASQKKKDEPSAVASAVLAGQTFVNKVRRTQRTLFRPYVSTRSPQGIVGFGFIPNDAKDSTGDTIGGIGSAIALKPGSFNAKSDGTFTGTLVVQPDRGYNV
jgi:hypothetical protein